MKTISSEKGMLFYIIKKIRPRLAERIKETGKIESIVVGLGGQGTRHAGLMKDFGTTITAGIAPGRGGTTILETIPVYNSVRECLKEHPNIAVASIWRHYSTAKNAALEVIESGIPVVVLITEGIPLRDIRDIIVSARKHKTLLIGGNTPGVIFPPEGIKIGMLPDVFYPEEASSDGFGPKGVTIISRSGAILYHMSDALASAGIAQNAVIGVGGDGAIGSTFLDLVPLAMGYENTELVVIAGEIGGCQEEILANDIIQHHEKYPKPIVAVLSGAHAPEGKTMGHAGAIVTPGQEYGTFESKKKALENAGVKVVNSQHDLIETVKSKLGGKTYFEIEHYYDKMRTIWESPPKKPVWGTLITKVEPNNLMISGYPLRLIIEKKGFLETVHLLVNKEFPDEKTLNEMRKVVFEALSISGPKIKFAEEDISKSVAKCLLIDDALAQLPNDQPVKKTAFCIGRIARYLGMRLGTENALSSVDENKPFSHVLYSVITGKENVNGKHARMLEAIMVASVDHGVTPPSAQVTIIAASTRAKYEVAVANGVSAITDVHGGAGAKAAVFFKECVSKSKRENITLSESTKEIIKDYVSKGKRVEGMGHRIHTMDPRRDVLWNIAEQAGIAGECVNVSKIVTPIFKQVRGMELPINVDGVIGAIVADIGLAPSIAKALFIYGRTAGLSAHYFEEITTQPQMRRINFSDAVYKGKEERKI